MRKFLVAAGVLVAMAGSGLAQGFGLQIAETGEDHAQGLFRTTGGMTIGDGIAFYGGRLSYGVIDGLLVFADLGWQSVEEWKAGLGLQTGAFYSTPIDVPFDTGVRSAVYKTFIDNSYDAVGGNVMMIASTNFNQEVRGLSVYSGLGFNVSRITKTLDSGKTHKNRVDPAMSAGVVMKFEKLFSVYLELSYVNDPFIGAGARFDF